MDEKELAAYRKAGKIAKDVREWSRRLVKPGAKLLDVADAIEKKIATEGGGVAFPLNICVNDITAHYTPKYNDETVVGEKDVVSVDLGVHMDGFIADTAYTIDFGGKHGRMLTANELALDKAIELVKPGAGVREFGKTVQETLKKAGYKPIENLTGHEVKQYNLHAGLSIPNIPVPYDWKLKEGMVLAIEPFATDGLGSVVESRQAEIYSKAAHKPTRVSEARKFSELVEDRGMLPFAGRWYAKEIGILKLNLALRELLSKGVFKAYPTLHEKGGGVVSQFEHTIIVTKDGGEVITR
jgi:methionyl aminopeptidase